jgi:uncharacterized protein
MNSEPEVSSNEATPGKRFSREVWAYLAITFGFSWVMTVGAIKLGLGEEYLNIGTAGPAIAALVLSRSGRKYPNSERNHRWLWLLIALMICWIVICLHYQWWSGTSISFQLRLLWLIPAIPPAWILSCGWAANEGVRNFVRRLVHPPGRWSIIALLFFPLLLGVPSLIAYRMGAPLIWPDLGGLTSAAVANAAMFFAFNFLFVGTLEEPGWRGFLLDRLQRRFSPLTASLLVWLPWALWHAPVDYYRPVRFTLVQEILLRVVFLIPLTIILTWFYNRSCRSIQTTAIFHAAMNTFPYVVPYYQNAWLVVFLFAICVVAAERMWSRQRQMPILPEE